MIIRYKDFKYKNAISASRLDSYLECTQKYAFRYLYNCPDTTNDGAARGSTSHDIFEVLSNPRHEKHVKKIISDQTCKQNKPLWKLIERYATKYNVADQTNIDLIDQFILTGVSHDFHGPENTVKAHTEKSFDLEIDNGSISYRIRGFIDRIFEVQSEDGIYLVVRDYKSSKSKFEKAKLSLNHQAIIYQLAIKYLFPEYKQKDFHFLFLKFPDEPVQKVELFSDAMLFGYEVWLTEIQQQLENFSEKDAGKNYAAMDQTLLRTRCGKEGFKKDGSPYFICPAQKPFDYYVLINKDKKVINSDKVEENLIPKDGERVELRSYLGCGYFFRPDGKKRNFQRI